MNVPLKIKGSKSEAVPSIFSDFPTGNTTRKSKSRVYPESKKMARGMKILKQSIIVSKEAYEEYHEKRKVNSINDIVKCIEEFGISKLWTFHTDNSSSLFFFYIKFHLIPFIVYSIKIVEDLKFNFLS